MISKCYCCILKYLINVVIYILFIFNVVIKIPKFRCSILVFHWSCFRHAWTLIPCLLGFVFLRNLAIIITSSLHETGKMSPCQDLPSHSCMWFWQKNKAMWRQKIISNKKFGHNITLNWTPLHSDTGVFLEKSGNNS